MSSSSSLFPSLSLPIMTTAKNRNRRNRKINAANHQKRIKKIAKKEERRKQVEKHFRERKGDHSSSTQKPEGRSPSLIISPKLTDKLSNKKKARLEHGLDTKQLVPACRNKPKKESHYHQREMLANRSTPTTATKAPCKSHLPKEDEEAAARNCAISFFKAAVSRSFAALASRRDSMVM